MKTNFNFSKAVREITVAVETLDLAQTPLFVLPKGARILDFIPNVQTGFGGSETMTIGTTGVSVFYATGIAIAARGQAAISVLNGTGEELTVPTTITALVSGGTGSVALTCVYSMPQQAA